jgi:hypothetical protein
MALLRSVLLIVAISLAVLIDEKVVLLAQGSGDSTTMPAIRTGNFSQAASLLEKAAEAGDVIPAKAGSPYRRAMQNSSAADRMASHGP